MHITKYRFRMLNEVIINKTWKKLMKDMNKNSNIINMSDFLIKDNITEFNLNFSANTMKFNL